MSNFLVTVLRVIGALVLLSGLIVALQGFNAVGAGGEVTFVPIFTSLLSAVGDSVIYFALAEILNWVS